MGKDSSITKILKLTYSFCEIEARFKGNAKYTEQQK